MPAKALLVIDMQKDLCYDLRRKSKVAEIITPIKNAVRLFDSADQPVYYVCLALPPDDQQFERFGDKYCVEGTDGANIIPELLPLKGTLVTKRKHSAFFETGLDRLLQGANVHEIYLAGLQTQICIMTTAADASFRGYRVVALRDCVVSSREENKEMALSWIERYVGEVTSLADVAREFDCTDGI